MTSFFIFFPFFSRPDQVIISDLEEKKKREEGIRRWKKKMGWAGGLCWRWWRVRSFLMILEMVVMLEVDGC